MGKKYGIRNYARLLRVAKRDRDEDLEHLKARQQNRDGNIRPEGKKSKRRKRKRGSRLGRDVDGNSRHTRRASPSYGETYSDDDDSTTDDDELDSSADEKSDFVIEFGSTSGPEDHLTHRQTSKQRKDDQSSISPASSTKSASTSNSSTQSGSTAERKLTPMEKLKMKMRAGLEKTIQSDETIKLQKEQERQIEGIEQYAKERNGFESFGPIITSITQPPAATTKTTSTPRYRSPPSSRSPSPETNRSSSSRVASRQHSYHSPDRHHRSTRKSSRHDDRYRRSNRSRSRSRSPRHHRSRSRSRSPRHHRHRSRSPRHRHYRHRSKSPSPKRRKEHWKSR
ncbi:hypothetical protein BC941DRAFT_92306 [Chlamydoabsidia padenii]|nr:hypothetical protein BC941DRAFT_92306 [Chlamydoabsidia padenii]